MFGSLKNEIIEIKGTINKIYNQLMEVVKLVKTIDDHERRIERLEDKMDRVERFIIEIKTKDCEPIQETDDITFEDIGEILKNEHNNGK